MTAEAMPERAMAHTVRLPHSGEVLLLERRASVQFTCPAWARVVALPWSTYAGWRWLRVHQLDRQGAAVAVRGAFVRPASLLRLPPGRPLMRPAPPVFQQRCGRAWVVAGGWSR